MIAGEIEEVIKIENGEGVMMIETMIAIVTGIGIKIEKKEREVLKMSAAGTGESGTKGVE